MKEEIYPIAIEDKMKDAYLNYSLSVIIGRALPDVRDGLKPVHRRILFAARELGLLHNRPHKKSARLVGEVLGKFHPHGDSAVYEAMVRMAQDFNQRYQLIDGQGNYGSIDGDSAAAMRYTETKLTEIAEALLDNIDEKTVNFIDNFDGSLQEPEVLPSKIPNLLVNGSSGIAVGMSTSIPPHNLNEVIDALIHLLDYPNAKLDTIIKNHLPGPDFPTGAMIVGDDGIKSAYETGKGKITLRAKSKIEKESRYKKLIITEIPYQVNKAKLIEEIAELVNKGKISEVSDLRDESDKEGIRIVIELKSNADTELILNRLYKYTSLQNNFRINLLALNNKKPVVMGLLEILDHFLNFRKEVIRKHTKYNLDKSENRYHILEGLKKAIDELDVVIQVIRNSESKQEAKEKLMQELDISEKQAQSILEMQLQRLVGMEFEKLEAERKDLAEKIKYYKNILNNQDVLNTVLRDELKDIKKRFGDARRTEIISDDSKAEITKDDLIKEKNAVLSLSYRGIIKRNEEYKNLRAAKNDYLISTIEGSSLDQLLFFSDHGEVYNLQVHDIEEHHDLATGDNLSKYVQIPIKENIISFSILAKEELESSDEFYTFVTEKGLIKRSIVDEYRTNYSHIRAIKLDDDQVLNVEKTDEQQDLFVVSKNGYIIRFSGDSFSTTGRNTLGSRAINLAKNDKVIYFNTFAADHYLVSISEDGRANKIKLSNFRAQKRNGKGIRIFSNTKYKLAGAVKAAQTDKILIAAKNGEINEINVKDIPETSPGGNMYQVTQDLEFEKIMAVEKIIEIK
ncbi:DNA gyrase subunit A [Halanaerobium congolense]|jgi:DNA gyrase subunit A|uniref:DNA topoisomerase (ATP-hydrolyzing) n=1 Tax=Halanaerobium congolense TaxID=54121 RepID=A0A1H9XZ14_9FIRM|nr:DNA gyrase subunit A [Halanaerobium congolense]PTX17172.1 LOW QUALITY PROTEIN: DNA gyrase subunit A [Halanaerobium congolense]SDE73399.1 DNA gyrase subunit A [Halanaerobium congolense]SDG83803.1 DNA gyrase subunit A [Halanaerobium congolense]SES61498.1 DNA gyrase subunit A [Halanaerobium congolense]SFO84587.1 DNA gyrase subunit A [Halanaerobium congolense]